jgi:hypothetical protein
VPKTFTPGVVCTLVATVVALGLSAALLSPGFQSIDEGVYYLQARALIGGHPFDLRTGYDAIPSPEFLYFVPGITAHTQVGPVGVVGQYPVGYPVLAAGPLAALGPVGLVVPNLIASVLGIGLVGHVAAKLWKSPAAGYFAAILTLTASFWIDHAFAMWPHVAATTPVLGALVLLARVGQDDVSFARALCAGLLLGLAVSMRLDSVVLAAGVLAAVALPPVRTRALAGVLAGLAPFLAGLALVNETKFGVPNPLSYGTPVDVRTAGAAGYAELVPLLLGWFAVAWMASARAGRGRSLPPRALAIGLTVAVIVTAVSWETLVRLLVGGYVITFDLAALPDEMADMERLESGAIVFSGTVKKSLLQSCPYLLASGWFIARSWWQGNVERRRNLELFALPALTLLVFFSYRAWHGGASHNVRYLLPVIPLAAVAGAGLVDEFRDRISPGWRWGLAGSSLLAMAASAYAGATAGAGLDGVPPPDQELWVREIPMMLGFGALVGVVVGLHDDARNHPVLLAVAGGLIAIAVAWSTGLGTLDAWRTHSARENAERFSGEVAALVEPDAVVITPALTATFGLLERDGIWLASPQADGGRDMGRVVRGALELGKRVYLVFPMTRGTQELLAGQLPGQPMVVRPISSGYGVIVPRGQ